MCEKEACDAAQRKETVHFPGDCVGAFARGEDGHARQIAKVHHCESDWPLDDMPVQFARHLTEGNILLPQPLTS